MIDKANRIGRVIDNGCEGGNRQCTVLENS